MFMFLIFTDTTVLQNCRITSSSVGTITISCDSPYQILVTLTCAKDCNDPIVTSIGNSSFTVRGLDPGMIYSVTINVFDGNQVVFRELMIATHVTVMKSLGKTFVQLLYVHICIGYD